MPSPGERRYWVLPDVRKVTYVTDVEGHWKYFCNFVDLSDGVFFETRGDMRDARTTPPLVLEPDWHFVFGGDSCDKGPGTLRFLEAVVGLKKRYPDRVHLLLGNRDINKMRWTSEFTKEEIDRLTPETPGAFWVEERHRLRPWQYLTTLAAASEEVDPAAVTEEMVRKHNTVANRFRYHLKCDMGSDGEFEFRRQELAIMSGKELQEVSDDQVVQSYLDSVAEGGVMHEYIRLGELACLLGTSLFVHGQIIGNQFIDCGDQAEAWAVTAVPQGRGDRFETVQDVRQWVVQLNEWACSQVKEWGAQPTWSVPPTEPTYEAFSARGGAGLIAYGTPRTRVPSVVYCRWLEGNSMPKPFPSDLVTYLTREGIKRVIVGHTPHGNCPTVIPHDGSGLHCIMADTSYSNMKSDASYPGDNRGDAVCEVTIEGDRCSVRGRTGTSIEEGMQQVVDYTLPDDPHVGIVQPTSEQVPRDARFFVKARLPPLEGKGMRYLLCRVDGFVNTYQEELESQVVAAFGSGMPLKRNDSTVEAPTCLGDDFATSIGALDASRAESIFRRLDRDRDGRVTSGELLAACTDNEVREALMLCFPGESLQETFAELDFNRDGTISISELRRALVRQKS